MDDRNLNNHVTAARHLVHSIEQSAARSSMAPYELICNPGTEPALAIELAWAAWTLDDRRALPALRLALVSGPADVREAAARALGQMGDHSSKPALFALLLSDEGGPIAGAVEALALLGGPDTLAAFQAVLDDERRSDHVRGMVAEYASLVRGGEALVETLHHLTRSPSAVLRFWSAHSLGAIGEDESLGYLRALLGDTREAWRGLTVGDEAKAAVQCIEGRLAP